MTTTPTELAEQFRADAREQRERADVDAGEAGARAYEDAAERVATLTTASAALAQALADLADVFGDGMTAGHVGPNFSCGEAERIAHVLRLAGHTAAAETWLDGHAEGDDDADDDPEHIERAERIEAKRAAFMAGWKHVDDARRIVSERGLTAMGTRIDKHGSGPSNVHVHASGGKENGRGPVERVAYAVELLTRRGWTVVTSEPRQAVLTAPGA